MRDSRVTCRWVMQSDPENSTSAQFDLRHQPLRCGKPASVLTHGLCSEHQPVGRLAGEPRAE